jgi:hypothetical protein
MTLKFGDAQLLKELEIRRQVQSGVEAMEQLLIDCKKGQAHFVTTDSDKEADLYALHEAVWSAVGAANYFLRERRKP